MEEYKKWSKQSYTFKTEDQIINFGINEGKKIVDIMISDPKYIEWCIKNFKGFKLSKKLQNIFENIKTQMI